MKKNLLPILAIVLILAMAFSLVACVNNDKFNAEATVTINVKVRDNVTPGTELTVKASYGTATIAGDVVTLKLPKIKPSTVSISSPGYQTTVVSVGEKEALGGKPMTVEFGFGLSEFYIVGVINAPSLDFTVSTEGEVSYVREGGTLTVRHTNIVSPFTLTISHEGYQPTVITESNIMQRDKVLLTPINHKLFVFTNSSSVNLYDENFRFIDLAAKAGKQYFFFVSDSVLKISSTTQNSNSANSYYTADYTSSRVDISLDTSGDSAMISVLIPYTVGVELYIGTGSVFAIDNDGTWSDYKIACDPADNGVLLRFPKTTKQVVVFNESFFDGKVQSLTSLDFVIADVDRLLEQLASPKFISMTNLYHRVYLPLDKKYADSFSVTTRPMDETEIEQTFQSVDGVVDSMANLSQYTLHGESTSQYMSTELSNISFADGKFYHDILHSQDLEVKFKINTSDGTVYLQEIFHDGTALMPDSNGYYTVATKFADDYYSNDSDFEFILGINNEDYHVAEKRNALVENQGEYQLRHPISLSKMYRKTVVLLKRNTPVTLKKMSIAGNARLEQNNNWNDKSYTLTGNGDINITIGDNNYHITSAIMSDDDIYIFIDLDSKSVEEYYQIHISLTSGYLDFDRIKSVTASQGSVLFNRNKLRIFVTKSATFAIELDDGTIYNINVIDATKQNSFTLEDGVQQYTYKFAIFNSLAPVEYGKSLKDDYAEFSVFSIGSSDCSVYYDRYDQYVVNTAKTTINITYSYYFEHNNFNNTITITLPETDIMSDNFVYVYNSDGIAIAKIANGDKDTILLPLS